MADERETITVAVGGARRVTLMGEEKVQMAVAKRRCSGGGNNGEYCQR